MEISPGWTLQILIVYRKEKIDLSQIKEKTLSLYYDYKRFNCTALPRDNSMKNVSPFKFMKILGVKRGRNHINGTNLYALRKRNRDGRLSKVTLHPLFQAKRRLNRLIWDRKIWNASEIIFSENLSFPAISFMIWEVGNNFNAIRLLTLDVNEKL